MKPCVRARFIKSKGFVSSGIAFWTNSLFDHVEFGTPGGTWIGAHWEDGVQQRPAAYCAPSREYYYEIPCSPKEEDDALNWMRSKIGMRYNRLDILGLLIHSRRIESPHRVICSQFFTDGMLRFFGPRRYENVLPDFDYLVTPEMAHLSPILAGNLVRRLG